MIHRMLNLLTRSNMVNLLSSCSALIIRWTIELDVQYFKSNVSVALLKPPIWLRPLHSKCRERTFAV